MLRKPQPRYGWSQADDPSHYGVAYARANVIPGEIVYIIDYGEATILAWNDPDVVASFPGSTPLFNDGYVYARLIDGEIDGYSPSAIRKLQLG